LIFFPDSASATCHRCRCMYGVDVAASTCKIRGSAARDARWRCSGLGASRVIWWTLEGVLPSAFYWAGAFHSCAHAPLSLLSCCVAGFTPSVCMAPFNFDTLHIKLGRKIAGRMHRSCSSACSVGLKGASPLLLDGARAPAMPFPSPSHSGPPIERCKRQIVVVAEASTSWPDHYFNVPVADWPNLLVLKADVVVPAHQINDISSKMALGPQICGLPLARARLSSPIPRMAEGAKEALCIGRQTAS
jgi:hypothetical protein